MNCPNCGKPENQWEWLFFHVGRTERVCGCQVNLDGATLYPWGFCPSLDDRISDIADIVGRSAKVSE